MRTRKPSIQLFLAAFLVSFAVLLGGWLTPTPATAAPTGTASISGSLVDSDGNSVENILIQVYRWNENEEDPWYNYYLGDFSDENGDYTVGGLPAGKYIIQFANLNDKFASQWWTGTDGGTPDRDGAKPITLTTIDQLVTGINAKLQTGATITGKVIDSNGNPVEGIFVDAHRWNENEEDPWYEDYRWGYSDENGDYTIGGLPAGKYIIQFNDWNHRFVSQWWTGTDGGTPDRDGAKPITLTTGQETTGINAKLQTGATITGKVTDSNGNPVEDIFVDVHRWNQEESQYDQYSGEYSDENGDYTVGGLPAGKYIMEFGSWNDKFITQWWTGTDGGAPDQDGAKPITLTTGQQTTGINAKLQTGATITGKVTDSNGNPVEHIDIEVYRWNEDEEDPWYNYYLGGYSDENGDYTVGGLPAGKYIIEFNDWNDEFVGQWWTGTDGGTPDRDGAKPITLTTGQETTGINAKLQTGATITGKVTDSNGNPVEDSYVSAYRWNQNKSRYDHYRGGYSDENGDYTVGGLAAGKYIVQFNNWDGPLASQWWTGNDGGAPDQDGAKPITLATGQETTGINAKLQTGATITGKVTDSNGNPVEDIFVFVYRWDKEESQYEEHRGGYSDENGDYTVGGLAAGKYIVQFNNWDGPLASQWWTGNDGGAPDQDGAKPITLTTIDQQVTGINAKLQTGATITGKVTDSNGNPVEDSYVNAYRWNEKESQYEEYREGYFDENGDYKINGLPTGKYIVRFEDGEGNYPVQWWDGKNSMANATQIEIVADEVIRNINAQLGRSKELTVGTPAITGTATFGNTLTAEPGNWTTDTTFTYQWLRDGTTINGATNNTYKLGADDLDTQITVTVEGTKPGYKTAAETSAPTEKVAPATLTVDTPTITGNAAVGNTLTAQPGNWTTDTTFTYQWLRNGTTINGATNNTYKLGADDLDTQITVTVEGTKPGYKTAAETSAPTEKVAPATQVVPDTLKAATPTISGTVKAGKTLTAKPGTWTSGTKFEYQWYLDGSAIKNATKSTYKIQTADGGKKITVRVTGSKAGYTSTAKTSKATKTVPLSTLKTATPKITGTAKVGKTLTAKPGTWTSSTKFKYQWYRGSTAIKGATNANYKLVKADAKKKIKVKVTGSKTGYKTASKTSKATKAVKN